MLESPTAVDASRDVTMRGVSAMLADDQSPGEPQQLTQVVQQLSGQLSQVAQVLDLGAVQVAQDVRQQMVQGMQ